MKTKGTLQVTFRLVTDPIVLRISYCGVDVLWLVKNCGCGGAVSSVTPSTQVAPGSGGISSNIQGSDVLVEAIRSPFFFTFHLRFSATREETFQAAAIKVFNSPFFS